MNQTFYFTNTNIRKEIKRNIDTWNNCIEDILYIKYLILACNGKTIKKEEAENYFSRIRSPSVSPFIESINGNVDNIKGGVFTEEKKKDFDLVSRDECRKWFNPSFMKNKQYIRGEVHPELFRPLLTKQQCLVLNSYNEIETRTIRKISYHNIFNLCLPKELLIGQEGAKSINLKFLDWPLNFWVHLFPSFNIKKLDLRTVNNLIALYSEVIRTNATTNSKDNSKNITRDDNLWADLDILINEIQNFQLVDGYFDLTDDDVYFAMSKLLSGSPKFYYHTVIEIKQPLLNFKFNTVNEALRWAFTSFEPKHFHEIRTIAFNFLEDKIGIDINLSSTGSIFTKPDNKIDLLIKIFDGIINHSDKKNYYKKLTKLADLLTVIESLDDEKIQDEEQIETDDPFKVLRKKQDTLLKTFSMCMLTELFYSDKIKVIDDNGDILKRDTYNLYDLLLYVSIKNLRNGFNGKDNEEGKKLFESCGLLSVDNHEIFFKNRYISHYLVEEYINEESFKKEFLENAYTHNFILPKDFKKFPKTCRALKHNKSH